MERIIILISIVLAAFSLSWCSSKVGIEQSKSVLNPKEKRYENISPKEAKQRLDNEKGIILLDVRTPEEYSEKHIPGSILIPVDIIEKEAPSKLADKNAIMFIYCRSGRRSVAASEALVKMGYTSIYNLGGINDWPYDTKSGK